MNANVPPPVPEHSADDLIPSELRRYIPLIASIGIGIAVFGFLANLREPLAYQRSSAAPTIASELAPSAVTYSELPTAHIGPNANWQQALAQLSYDKPNLFDPVTRTEAMKQDALADRARNRAYDGAPPTVPHPVDAQSSASCLVCHGEGLKVGDRVASKISHGHLTNCTQCHVEEARVGLPSPSEAVENDFVGVYRAGPGQRASPGAPPTIPHHTWMRNNCTSCHGLVTRPGIRTTHPWLTNCLQCHAPSATLDHVDFNAGVK